MDRRQLIKSIAALALAGSATPVGAATTAADKAPWKTVHLDHISYAVSDYKKSAEWYSNLMGRDIANDNGKNQATLRIGNVGEIIIRNNRQPEGAPAPSTPSGQPGRPPITGVINHVSYGISPWDKDFERYHVLDPDGWDLQISNQTKVG